VIGGRSLNVSPKSEEPPARTVWPFIHACTSAAASGVLCPGTAGDRAKP
jgi:hypothetical protein